MNVSFWLDGKEFKMNVMQTKGDGIRVTLEGKAYDVSVEFIEGDEILLNCEGKIHNVMVTANSTSYTVYVNGRCFQIEKKSVLQILGPKMDKQRIANVQTSMPGRIVKILMKEGDEVCEGQAVMILEAMKMQNEIKSPQSGQIGKIAPQTGDSVETGALLFTVT
jgi:biotin carboxyl carrier protein